METPSLWVFAFVVLLAFGLIVLLWLWLSERRRALHDDLTGLPNYRAFLLQAAKHLHKGNNRGVGLALTDMDDFRRYNESGYQEGDKILIAFSTTLCEAVKGYAFCARYRLGDEFVLLFDPGDEHIILTRLQTLSQQGKDASKLRFSYGIGVFKDSGDSIESMLEVVQRKLQMNKKIQEV